MRQVDPVRKALEFSSCRGYKNYFEGSLPLRGKGCRTLTRRGKKNLIPNVYWRWTRIVTWLRQ